MRFIQTYKSPNVIGIGDNVRYKNKNYQVLINYIKGETDAKGYTPKSNRTILIDDDDNRIVCDDFTKLRINEEAV
jgi:hypothetical protein